jgi:pimeloyl-ACP methyl ester carboxylesterase
MARFAARSAPLRTPRHGRVPGAGVELAYREWPGADPAALPLVLLHGLTGWSADWEPVVARLPGGRRIVALDARGHGASGWAADEAYMGDAHFADVATALDALAIERCILAGYSMGGSVAILVAGALPDRVAGVVVVDSYPAPEMTPGSRAIAEAIALAWPGWDGAGRFDPAIARQFADQIAAGDPRRLDLWPFWEAIRSPVLLVRGELSTVLTAPLAAEMLARQPAARLELMPAVGHTILFAAPGELAAQLERFAAAIG